MAKTVDDFFVDWEGHVFGYGYGSGEPHTIPALQVFLGAIPDNGIYSSDALELACGPDTTWLLINTLCHADILEYGTSPRYGWLSEHGTALKAYVSQHNSEALIEIVTSKDEHYIPCYPTHCNCDDGPCRNPFWPHDTGANQ